MTAETPALTRATEQRVACLCKRTIGYDPLADSWTGAEALEVLREFRAEDYLPGQQAAL